LARPLLLTLAVLAWTSAVAQPASAFSDADYFAFADRLVLGMEASWDPVQGVYLSRHKGATARTNANLLLIHATAARYGHAGASRQDERARRLVARMVRPPMLDYRDGRGWTPRSACWTKLLTRSGRDHVSLDSQVAEALAAAWRARRRLGLGASEAARVARAVDRCARHPAWRFPHLLKNQFNWSAQLYAADADVTGRRDLLRRDYRRHLVRFAAAIRRPRRGMRSPNLGPGFGFHYNPELPASTPGNFDTPEYANIVASALQHYPRALRAGMRPLRARDLVLLRRWVTRLLTGSWTHAGYLNWDTGHGTRRWHSGQYWAFAEQGLLAIAAAPQLWSRPSYGRWAKALLDRGLRLYARWGDEVGGAIAPQLPFDVFSDHRDHDLYATRTAANAMRAVALGLGDAPSALPPPLYSFDRETSRLAVTTPSYSTAVVPDNRNAFPYGGIELARLFDGEQRVAATTGGTPPHAFGVVVGDPAGRTLLASEDGAEHQTRLRLLGGRPPAGPFRELRASGRVAAHGITVTTTHRFRARDIAVRWDVRCRAGCAARYVDVHLPTWGTGAIEIRTRDGGHAPLSGVLPLAGVLDLDLAGRYTVTPISRPGGAVVFPVATVPQPTAPHPGPTVGIRLVAGRTFERIGLAVRIRL
jgi:hypothetical protein